jgi:tRNA (cytidine/uridine-2'-O-)-methyltransferase
VALAPGAETALWAFRFAPGDTLLLGAESTGLPRPVLDAAPARLRIPMQPGARSLNVGMAAAIAAAEALRQLGA